MKDDITSENLAITLNKYIEKYGIMKTGWAMYGIILCY